MFSSNHRPVSYVSWKARNTRFGTTRSIACFENLDLAVPWSSAGRSARRDRAVVSFFLLRVKERALYLSRSSRTSTFRLAHWGQLSSETRRPRRTKLWRLYSQCTFKEILRACNPPCVSVCSFWLSSFRPRSGACHFPILRSAFVLCCDSNHILSWKVYGRTQLFVIKSFLWRCTQGGWVVRSLRSLLVKPCSQNPCSASILLNLILCE